MHSNDDNCKSLDSLTFSNVSQEDLIIIKQAEDQLNHNKDDKVILIAYDMSIQ